jgi:RNA polymerase sigma-70 factor (sigma-E family)
VRERDRTEYVDFVQARYQALYRTSYLLSGNPHAAEDLLQSVLTKLYVSWPRVRKARSVEAYARRAMVNESISLHRRRWTTEVVSDDLVDLAAPARAVFRDSAKGSIADAVAESHAMWQALAELTGRQRAVVVLRYYEDLTEADIAAVLGISPGSVKGHARAALAALATRVPGPTAAVGEEGMA